MLMYAYVSIAMEKSAVLDLLLEPTKEKGVIDFDLKLLKKFF